MLFCPSCAVLLDYVISIGLHISLHSQFYRTSYQTMAFQPRCSLCYKEIVSPQSIFTSCGHFLCPSCVGSRMNGSIELCPKCGQTCSILYVDVGMAL